MGFIQPEHVTAALEFARVMSDHFSTIGVEAKSETESNLVQFALSALAGNPVSLTVAKDRKGVVESMVQTSSATTISGAFSR